MIEIALEELSAALRPLVDATATTATTATAATTASAVASASVSSAIEPAIVFSSDSHCLNSLAMATVGDHEVREERGERGEHGKDGAHGDSAGAHGHGEDGAHVERGKLIVTELRAPRYASSSTTVSEYHGYVGSTMRRLAPSATHVLFFQVVHLSPIHHLPTHHLITTYLLITYSSPTYPRRTN